MKPKKCPCCGADFTLKQYLKQSFLDFRIRKFDEDVQKPIKCHECGEIILKSEDFVSSLLILLLLLSIIEGVLIYSLDEINLESIVDYLLFGFLFIVAAISVYFISALRSYRDVPLMCYKYMQKQKIKTRNIDFSENPKSIIFLAIVGALMMFGSIGCLWYSTLKIGDIKSIYLLAYSKEHGAVFNMDKTLFFTDTNGKLISKKSLKSLGLKNLPSDIAFYKNSILAVDGHNFELLKCSLNGCEKLSNIPKHKSIDITITPDEKKFYLLYGRSGNIYYFDINATKLYSLHVELDYPNDIIAQNNNELIVADTYNKRVIKIKHDKDKVTTLWELDVPKSLKFNYPLSVIIDKKGRIWTLTMDEDLYSGKIKILNIDKKSKNQTISTLKMPHAIQKGDDFMLISDDMDYGVHVVSLDGKVIKKFGDKSLIAQMEKLKKEKGFWFKQVDLSYLGIILSIIILFFCGVYDYVKNQAKIPLLEKLHIYSRYQKELEENEIIKPDSRGIIWLTRKIDNSSVWQIVWLILLFFVIYAFLIGFFYLYFDEFILPPISSKNIYFMILLFIILIIILIYSYNNNEQIGVLGDMIYIKHKSGKIVNDYAKNAKVSQFYICILNQSIPFAKFNTPIFNQSQFNHYILPILKKAKPTNEIDVFLLKFRSL